MRGQVGEAERDGRKDGRPDGQPGEGAAFQPARPSAPAPGGGAGEGRGRRDRDNNPAARLWGRRREGRRWRPSAAEVRPAPRRRLRPCRLGPAAVGSAGRSGRSTLESLRGRPLPAPSPARAELVFRVPLDRAGSCCSPRQEVSFAR